MHGLKTLVANIQREWLARILDGSKKIEYRDATDYWLSRLDRVGPPPFLLRLINGMRTDAPEATLLVNRVDIDMLAGQIRLHLARVVETVGWNPEWHQKYPALAPEPPVDSVSVFDGRPAQSRIRLTVSSDLLASLAPGKSVTFSHPLTQELYEQFVEAPEAPYLVWVEAGDRAVQVALVEAYDRGFEDVADLTVVARPE